MGERSSCISGLQQYLEASYVCKNAYKPEPSKCADTHDVVITSSALVTSDSLYKSRCVRQNERWTLSTTGGQRLNISLIDFSQRDHPSNDEMFGHVTDDSISGEVPLIAQSRQQHVMTSSRNVVSVTLHRDRRFAFDTQVSQLSFTYLGTYAQHSLSFTCFIL